MLHFALHFSSLLSQIGHLNFGIYVSLVSLTIFTEGFAMTQPKKNQIKVMASQLVRVLEILQEAEQQQVLEPRKTEQPRSELKENWAENTNR